MLFEEGIRTARKVYRMWSIVWGSVSRPAEVSAYVALAHSTTERPLARWCA